MYLKMMEPLSMCKQQSRKARDMEACMYYSCSRCAQTAVTGQLIQFVIDSAGKALPMWRRDLKSILDGDITQQCITAGCVMGRYCQACFCEVTGERDITASKFHDYVGDS